jgi:hypothetical protein
LLIWSIFEYLFTVVGPSRSCWVDGWLASLPMAWPVNLRSCWFCCSCLLLNGSLEAALSNPAPDPKKVLSSPQAVFSKWIVQSSLCACVWTVGNWKHPG